MNNKNKSITYSQALKLYTGDGLLLTLIKTTGFSILGFLAAVITIMVLSYLHNDNTNDFFGTASIDVCMNIVLSIPVSIMISLTYEKDLPGGKFFRTARNSFELYEKMRTAIITACTVTVVLYCSVLEAMDESGIIKLYHGSESVKSTVVFMIIAMNVGIILQIISNSGARVLTVIIVFNTITSLGAAILKLNNGNIGYVYYAAAIIGSVLLFVNNKIMLSYYKKHRWNN